MRFESTNDELIILQKFDGLNVWDQLSVDISIRGSLPSVSPSASIEYPDVSDEFVYRTENRIRSLGSSKISVDGQDIPYTIEQTIEFEKCPYADNDGSVDLSPVFSKVSKITAKYQERETALRVGMVNKVVRNTPVNRCTDGSATCGANSICLPDPINDSYSVSSCSIEIKYQCCDTSSLPFVCSVNAEMDSRCSKVKRHKCALTLMNAATQISATRTPTAIMSWAVTVANVEMVSAATVSSAKAFQIMLTFLLKLTLQHKQSKQSPRQLLKWPKNRKALPQNRRTRPLQPAWLSRRSGFAISAPTMRNASKAFVYARMVGMAMDMNANTIVRPILYGALTDAYQSVLQTKTNVSEFQVYVSPTTSSNCECIYRWGATVLPYARMFMSNRLRVDRNGTIENMPIDWINIGSFCWRKWRGKTYVLPKSQML